MKQIISLLLVSLIWLAWNPLEAKGKKDPVPTLVQQLKKGSVWQKLVAIKLMKKYLPDPRVIKALIEAFNDKVKVVGAEAVTAFWRAPVKNHPNVVRKLGAALQRDPHAQVRQRAANAFFSGYAGSDVIRPLIAALKDRSTDVRVEAFEILCCQLFRCSFISDTYSDSDYSINLKLDRELIKKAFKALCQRLHDDPSAKVLSLADTLSWAVTASHDPSPYRDEVRDEVRKSLQNYNAYWNKHWKKRGLSSEEYYNLVQPCFLAALADF